MTTLKTCCSFWWRNIFRKLLKTDNVEVALQGVYAMFRDRREETTVGAFDISLDNLFLFRKFFKAIRAECVVAWQELGLMSLIIIRLFADTTIKKFVWGCGVRQQACHGYLMVIAMVRCIPSYRRVSSTQEIFWSWKWLISSADFNAENRSILV